MAKLTVELDDNSHQILFDIQNERRKKKIEPTAINKIASELLIKALQEVEKENPGK